MKSKQGIFLASWNEDVPRFGERHLFFCEEQEERKGRGRIVEARRTCSSCGHLARHLARSSWQPGALAKANDLYGLNCISFPSIGADTLIQVAHDTSNQALHVLKKHIASATARDPIAWPHHRRDVTSSAYARNLIRPIGPSFA